MPVSLVGGVRSLADMEAVIEAGIECVSLGRSLIAEPDFVTKELAGGEKSICVSMQSLLRAAAITHPGIRQRLGMEEGARAPETGRCSGCCSKMKTL